MSVAFSYDALVPTPNDSVWPGSWVWIDRHSSVGSTRSVIGASRNERAGSE